jgi:hypothetical protein
MLSAVGGGVRRPANCELRTRLPTANCELPNCPMLGGDEIAVKRSALVDGMEAPRAVVDGYSRANCEVAAITAQEARV